MKKFFLLIFTISALLCNAKTYKGYYNSGKPHYTFHKKKNVLHGSYIYWHSNGKKAVQGKFKNGERTGLWKAWYENGKLCYERNFENGEENGITRYYYENGQLQAAGPYLNNFREGAWNIWNEDGSKRAIGDCKLNSFHGKWKFYHADSVFIMDFKFGVMNLNDSNVKTKPGLRFSLRMIANTLVSVNQHVGNNSRLILRMNCMNTYALEKDNNCNYKSYGMLNFWTFFYLGKREINGDYLSGLGYSSLYQTGEYVNGKKDGVFKKGFQDFKIQEVINWDTLLYSEEFQCTTFKNDTLIGNYKIVTGGMVSGGKKTSKEGFVFSRINISQKTKTSRIQSSNISYNIENNELYRILQPIFNIYQGHDSLTSSTIMKNDTILISSNLKLFKIPFFIKHTMQYSSRNCLDTFCYINTQESFHLVSLSSNNKICFECSFIKDPLFEKFSYENEDTRSGLDVYMYEYLPDRIDIRIPYNHLLHGNLIIYDSLGNPSDNFLFDYGFLIDYKNLSYF